MESNTNTYEFFATCGRGLEGLLADELRSLSIKRVRPLNNGVAFFGSIEDGMRACLWLRTASRVLLILDRVSAKDSDTLYNSLYKIPWETHIAASGSLSIDAYGRNDNLRNSQFVAVRAKDAIVDRIRSKNDEGVRPSVQRERPDVLININLRGEKATIALDLSGEPLHRRGYRVESRAISAPLKESLAAAMLLAAGWNKGGKLLLDPFCGSGTIVIEAALIASDRAPGLLRNYWGFEGWLKYDENLWFKLLDEADERAAQGAEFLSELARPLIVAGDSDAKSLHVAVESAKRANLAQCIDFKGQLSADVISSIVQTSCQMQNSEASDDEAISVIQRNLLVTNPPYGQRLSSDAQLPAVYAELAEYAKVLVDSGPSAVSIITPDDLSEAYINRATGTVPTKRLQAMNGPIESDIRVWETSGDKNIPPSSMLSDTESPDDNIQDERVTAPTTAPEVDAAPFVNRLAKMAKHRAKWARRTGVSSYRVYDADLPDFNVAIDLYQGAKDTRDAGKSWLHIAEYKAPKEVDESLALARIAEILRRAPAEFDLRSQDVFLKQRRQARGGSQYSQDSDTQSSDTATDATIRKLPGVHLIEEGGLKFEVDLASKLDTGIFLDHRQVRALLREKSAGRDCLNLFAYTGTASVYMADGGARSVTTLDLSNTYLAWAKRNFALNHFELDQAVQKPHVRAQEIANRVRANKPELFFEKADALRWVGEQRALRKPAYDLIFIDVPTFSNSSAMGKRNWDVQRDHAELLIAATRLLRHDGEVVFSTNLRSFVPDIETLSKAQVNIENISKQTVPVDFERSPNIHHCFLVRKSRISQT